MRSSLSLALAVLLSGCCVPMPSSPAPGTTAPTPPPPGPSDRPTPATPAPGARGALASGPPVEPSSSGASFNTGLEHRVGVNLVPQLDDAWELFGSLTDGPGEDTVSGGLLLCDLRLPGTPMFRSRPDIQARFDIAGGLRILADAHNNRDSAVLSAPLGTLTRGDPIKVTVMDRDLFSRDDLIDGAQTVYQGHFPLVLTGIADKLHGTCRHVDAATVSRRLTPALVEARATLAALEARVRGGVDLAAPDLGYPWTEHLALQGGIDSVAALVGWTQADSAALRASFSALRNDWRTVAAAGAADALAGAALLGGSFGWGPVTVGPVVRLCGQDAAAALVGTPAADHTPPSCLLDVSITGAAPAVDLGGGRLELLSPDGRTVDPTVLVALPDRLLIDAAMVGASPNPATLQFATALRLTDGRTAAFLRLR